MADNGTLTRLEDQISWYDRKSTLNQRWYKWLKMIALTAAALVPFAAALSAPAWFTGGLGVVVVLCETVQQLNQHHHNWVTYRSTCETLKHEKFLYLATAGPYATASNPKALLAERVESLVSTEHAKWVSLHERVQEKGEGAPEVRR